MSMNTPFYIIPWNNNFIEELHSLIDNLTNGCPSKAVVVFSNDRPKRYLVDVYKNQISSVPVILPNIVTLEQLIGIFMKSWVTEIPRTASLLDQVSLLKDTILETVGNMPKKSSIKTIAKKLREEDGMTFFFPWGTHLAALLEECSRQDVTAQDFLYLTGEVLPTAAAILSSLKSIQEIFQQKLQKEGLSTPGRNLQNIALQSRENPKLPLILQNKIIILAGFLKLNKSENQLFKYLWENGAYICLDTDPKILSGKSHWSCRDHSDWIKNWHTDLKLFGTEREHTTNIHFFSAYSLHSQLIELKRTIAERDRNKHTRSAIVLCHDELLMPTLHHIDEKEINISLGYPLSRTLLFRLSERIFDVSLSLKKGSISTGCLKKLLRHPYINELGIFNEKDTSVKHLNEVLNSFEKELSLQGKYADLKLFEAELVKAKYSSTYAKELIQLLNTSINVLITDWIKIKTLQQLAESLNNLVHFLLKYNKHIWKRFPLDLECLTILTEKIIPELAENAMSSEKLNQETLFTIATQFLSEQRIPFNADPLTGLQVMGTLETRHLHFDNVYYLDMTEDAIPGKQQYDPLMPENLRFELGLSDTKHKDYISAYTFYRMLAGAKNAYLFWQEGSGEGLFDDKKSKSRFIEEELWKIEQQRGKILKQGESPLDVAAVPPFSITQPVSRTILRTDAINQRLLQRISGEKNKISATLLKKYMTCPVQFFHGTLCGIEENPEWTDSEDHLGLGILLHNTLKEAYTPFIGKEIRKGDITAEYLNDIFEKNFSEIEKTFNISPGSSYYLKAAIPYHIRKYLDTQPEKLTLLELEYSVDVPFYLGENTYTLYGKMDRIDKREDGILILDYKTGKSGSAPKSGFWDCELWEKMENWTPESLDDPLSEVAEQLNEIQLPLYLYLSSQSENMIKMGTAYNAAWIRLANYGKEEFLFSKKMNKEEKEDIVEFKIPQLLNFLFRHILLSREFRPHEGKICKNCLFKLLCRD